MNIELLRRVQAKLKRMRHAEHFLMKAWAKPTECGTAACIGGHGLIMQGYKFRPLFLALRPDDQELQEYAFISPKGHRVRSFNAAKREFGLTQSQAKRLFLAGNWPYEFRLDKNADPIFNNPKVAAARIEHFINTGGRE